MATVTPVPLDGITVLNPDEAAAFLNENPHTASRYYGYSNGERYRYITLDDKTKMVPARDLPPLPDGAHIVILKNGEDEQEIKAHQATLDQLKEAGYTNVCYLFTSNQSPQEILFCDSGTIGQRDKAKDQFMGFDKQPGQIMAAIAVNPSRFRERLASQYADGDIAGLLDAAWKESVAKQTGKPRSSYAIVQLSSGHIAYGFIDQSDLRVTMPHIVAACKQPSEVSEAMTIDQAQAQARAAIVSLVSDMAELINTVDVKTERLNQALAQLYAVTGEERRPFTRHDGGPPQTAIGVLEEVIQAATGHYPSRDNAGYPISTGCAVWRSLRDMIAVNTI